MQYAVSMSPALNELVRVYHAPFSLRLFKDGTNFVNFKSKIITVQRHDTPSIPLIINQHPIKNASPSDN